jgi:hypothetical protein
MRIVRTLLAFAFALPLFAETIVFRNAKVISMTSPKVATNQSVVVTDGRIVSVSSRPKYGKDAKVIDAKGKYLLPGLAEMHGHVPPLNAPNNLTDDVLFLYVANGVTTVRGMLGHPGQLELREKANTSKIISPTLYLAGPSFNGNSVSSTQEARDKVKQQKKEGWDLLKVHPGLTLDEYDAMAEMAAIEKIRFGGHVPADVGLLHAIEKGQETFDHIDGYVEALNGDKGPVDANQLAGLVKKSKDAGVWIVPTSALWEVLFNTIPLETLTAYPELKYAPPGAVDAWVKAYNNRASQTPREVANNVIRNRVTILRELHKGGVKILMGTDAPQQFSIPGFSLHRELLRMRDAGMSNYEILKSGTVNVGEYFNATDSFGTIEPGKRADLILLEANPLDDIANVSKIAGVMTRGKWLSRAEIDAGLAKIAK